ncbi:MAG: hypothetical protein ACRD50_00045 [Candidatus Acidiferrales bacterium]
MDGRNWADYPANRFPAGNCGAIKSPMKVNCDYVIQIDLAYRQRIFDLLTSLSTFENLLNLLVWKRSLLYWPAQNKAQWEPYDPTNCVGRSLKAYLPIPLIGELAVFARGGLFVTGDVTALERAMGRLFDRVKENIK